MSDEPSNGIAYNSYRRAKPGEPQCETLSRPGPDGRQDRCEYRVHRGHAHASRNGSRLWLDDGSPVYDGDGEPGLPIVTFSDGCDNDTLATILAPLAGYGVGDGWCVEFNGRAVIVDSVGHDGITWRPFDPETVAGNDEDATLTPWADVRTIEVN